MGNKLSLLSPLTTPMTNFDYKNFFGAQIGQKRPKFGQANFGGQKTAFLGGIAHI